MSTQGYVIAQSIKKTKYFTARSSYDNPQWISIDEATVYPTAEIAQASVAKLFKRGSFSAAVMPLAEVLNASLYTAQPPALAAPTTDVPAPQPESDMVAQDVEDVCDTCSHEPCTCPVDDETVDDTESLIINNQEIKLKTESIEAVESTDRYHLEQKLDNLERSLRDAVNTGDDEDKHFIGQEIKKITAQLAKLGDAPADDLKEAVDEPSDQLAAQQIASKIKGTPNLTVSSIKQYVTKYIPMVKKSPADVPYLTALVHSLLQDDGLVESAHIDSSKTTVTQIKLSEPSAFDNPDRDAGTTVASNHDEKIKVPASVRAGLKDVLAKFNKCSDPDFTHDDVRASFCLTVAAATQTLLDDLDQGTVAGLKQAQIHLTSFMNPITSQLPSVVTNYIISGGAKVSLKDVYNDKWDAKRNEEIM